MPPSKKNGPLGPRKAKVIKVQKKSKKTTVHQKKKEVDSSVKDKQKRLDLILKDLDHSYVGEYGLPEEPKPPRHPRWRYEGEESLDDEDQLPEDWTDSEPDLSDDDLEGQIERAKERIEDNIMVDRFQERLEELKGRLEERREMIRREPEGLSWPVIERLDCLTFIEKGVEQDGDPYDKLRSLRAVIAAYRAGVLKWNPGLVTYWCQGRQICQPRPYDPEEIVLICEHLDEQGGIWLEGSKGPGIGYRLARFTLPADNHVHLWNIQKQVKVNIQGHRTSSSLNFLDDTGCSTVTVFHDDVINLMDHPRPATIPRGMIVNYTLSRIADGSKHWSPSVMLNMGIRFLREDMVPSQQVECDVFSHARKPRGGEPRLLGPFLRSLLFTATAPDNRDRILEKLEEGIAAMEAPSDGERLLVVVNNDSLLEYA
ncbi:hypothetical protein N7492_006824 [Penicillium capsulatum]|uniref:Uncharacterized protein n=1 Tax=Penicillium capsulatum TaxID=69766 RepID=A0A9W9LK67_9EURO|nr:hypothetical protein N7492_006824 [Penicillium capsulatum]KAJ6116659.1 hypothetical protein N7512_006384 [Penicillium capsulatum]